MCEGQEKEEGNGVKSDLKKIISDTNALKLKWRLLLFVLMVYKTDCVH